MPTHTNTKLLLAFTFVTLGLLAFGSASIASGIITPDPAFGPDSESTIAMTLPPMDTILFTKVAPENIQAPDARPLAVFNAAIAKTVQGVAASFTGEYDPTQPMVLRGTQDRGSLTDYERTHGLIAFSILATLKYTFPEGVVLLTTTQPSAGALKYDIYMGRQEMLLANGILAWGGVYDSNTKPAFSNRLLWTQGNLILTLASDDLPLERLQELAAEVVMK